MALWIPVTIFAAFMQNLRFLMQRHLKVTTLSTAGATWARFLYAAPLVPLVLVGYLGLSGQSLPALPSAFWVYVVIGAQAQMLATMCVVALFARRNFTVGITLKKTEVILTALIGLVVLGEAVSPPILAAIAVGFAGVLLLSDPPPADTPLPWTARVFNPASGYGLASGVLFGLCSVCYRGATLSLDSGDAVLRAAVALCAATLVQTLTLGAWIAWRDRAQIGRVLASWRVSGPMGLTSMLGSMGWFTAFALQTAAYAKALGQIELVFTFLFSVFWLRERSSAKEIAGIALIVGSILLIFLGAVP